MKEVIQKLLLVAFVIMMIVVFIFDKDNGLQKDGAELKEAHQKVLLKANTKLN